MTIGEARLLLGVGPDVLRPTLRRAYLAALKATRPELGGDETRFRRIIEAYRLMERVTPRTAKAALPVPSGRCARAPLQISLIEALQGGERLVTLDGERKLRVHLPPGLREGATLRLRGQAPGGGDLLLDIRVGAGAGQATSAIELLRRFTAAWAA